MKLKTWLKTQNLTAESFGASIGYTGSALTRVLTGKRDPGPKLQKAIYLGTDSQVTPNDLFDFMPAGRWVLDKPE